MNNEQYRRVMGFDMIEANPNGQPMPPKNPLKQIIADIMDEYGIVWENGRWVDKVTGKPV